MGFGRLAVSASRLCHCCGSPVNFCSRGSKPVWTRCSKLDGAEISRRFFFFPNMLERPGKPGNPKETKVNNKAAKFDQFKLVILTNKSFCPDPENKNVYKAMHVV